MKQLARILLALAVVGGAPSQVLISGAGATFPYPIYARWFDEFQRLHPGAQITYQPIGSGAGLRQLEAGAVDFAASDCPIRNAKILLLHFPTVLGAVVPIYNLPDLDAELNFTPEALAGIFLGTIRRWDDPALTRVNPGVALPPDEIAVVHRSEASGTTFVWSDFLSKASPAWRSAAGAGMSLAWRVGVGARGNEGVAGLVKQTRNAIGYVELAYAVQNRLAYGRVRNSAGAFVKADSRSIAAAASALKDLPDDLSMSITGASGVDAYPVASFTWLLTPARIADPQRREIVAGFLRWMLVSGQRMAEPLGYAPLPSPVAAKSLLAVARIH